MTTNDKSIIEAFEVYATLVRATSHILQAGGADGIISRKDMRTKLLSLEGTERDLVDALYKFIDSRDAARSARVTKSDVYAAVAFLKTDLIERHDLYNNRLSEDEVARISELGKHAVTLARQLKKATAPIILTTEPTGGTTAPTGGTTAPSGGTTAPSGEATGLTGEALAQKIAELAKGLYLDDFGSEGGYGFAPFHAAAKLSQLTQDTFRATLGLTDGPKQRIEKFEPGDRSLQKIIGVGYDIDRGEQGEELVRFMKANLREISATVLGPYDPEQGAEYPVYIVGIDAAGNLVGLKSAAIWT